MNISSFWIYPTSVTGVTPQLILSSIRILEPAQDRVDLSRNNNPDLSWQDHLQELETEEEMGGVYITQGRDIVIPRSKIIDAPTCYADVNLPLFIDLAGSQSKRQISVIDEIAQLPPHTKGDFRANNCELTFGYHDIYQHGTDTQKPEFIARPTVSFCFWDYGSVNRDTFEEEFGRLPSIVALKTDFETLWGTVECAVTTLSS